MKLSLDPE